MGSTGNHHHHHQQQQQLKKVEDEGMKKSDHDDVHVPKGYMAVMVGREEQLKRFVIPVNYIYHPLFMELLREAEDEYGFQYHPGPINIPCKVQHFDNLLQAFINKDDHHFFTYNHQHHHHHHHHIIWTCFKA